ncbi:MAG: S41 family peptidase [Candidatus Krumholzibacteria bacterium]|nr:S41 family peptidase [Candidatus Krumholzibacteria bacterium]
MQHFPRHLIFSLVLAVILGAAGGWVAAGALEEAQPDPRSRREQQLEAAGLMMDVFDRVMLNYVDEMEARKIAEAAIQGMLKELDEHSAFLPPANYEDLMMSTEGEFGGLGITIQPRDHYPTVISPIEGTPAYYMQIQGGDQIIEIEGESTYDFSSQDAVKRLRGPKGTKVNITIRRPGSEQPIPLTITRDIIKVESVPHAFMIDDIGYVRINNFSRTTDEELRLKLDELTRQKMRGLILDLRTNPGGLLEAAKRVSELFLERGTLLVYTKGRLPANSMSFYAERRGQPYSKVPMVVMVNGSSASASEIVAAALQDHDAALVVGKTTFGKGSVQTVFRLNEEEALKLTTARYYAPSGRSIHMDRATEGHHLGEDDADLEEPLTELEPAPAQREIPRFQKRQYRTSGGRVVYGGGGVTPDIEIEQSYLSDFEVSVERDGALFGFAIEYASTHPNLPRDWQPDNAVMREFANYLSGRENIEEYLDYFGLSLGDSLLAANRDFLSWGIRRETMRRIHGAQAAYQVAIEKDTQLDEALALFKQARDINGLFALAQAWNEEAMAKAAADSAAAAGAETVELR